MHPQVSCYPDTHTHTHTEWTLTDIILAVFVVGGLCSAVIVDLFILVSTDESPRANYMIHRCHLHRNYYICNLSKILPLTGGCKKAEQKNWEEENVWCACFVVSSSSLSFLLTCEICARRKQVRDFNRSCISVKNYFKSPSGTSQPSFLYFEITHESLFKAAQAHGWKLKSMCGLNLSNLPLRVVSSCTPGLRPLSLLSLDRGLEVQLCVKLSSYQGLVSLR